MTKPILVAGASGFLGSHIVDFLLSKGHPIIALDNHQTGSPTNLSHLSTNPNFTFLPASILSLPSLPPLHQIYHFACPASPPQYQLDPINTLDTAYTGTKNLLDLATSHSCRILLSSTSEVYGDPQVHPQPESYHGNVNPFGPRACYDEGKRAAEALAYAYADKKGTDIRIARIFNTYGPRMGADDGRVVSNFISAAIAGEPVTVTGDGGATRSFLYVDDCVRGLYALMESGYSGPVNIGSEDELSVSQLAGRVSEMVRGVMGRREGVGIVFGERRVDDPVVRRADIALARRVLGWEPVVGLEVGLGRTVRWFLDQS